jgi:hypothetical protein
LEIATQDPKTLRVAWPAALSNYTLQSAALLATNSTWTNVATPPFIDGEKRVVLQSNAAPSRYYRLKK